MSSPGPLPPPLFPDPPVTEFYLRKRRLAYIFAALSAVVLFAVLYLGMTLDGFSNPRAVASFDSVTVVHRLTQYNEPPGSRLMILDPVTLKVRRDPYRLPDEATAALPDGDEITAFFGVRYAVLRDGETLRGADMGQQWEVRDAAPDPARSSAWVFGWSDGRILARRRVLGTWSEAIIAGAAGEIDRLTASIDGSAGPLVAWRERDTFRVKTMVFNGSAFVPGPEFDTGDVQYWDVAQAKDRVVCVTYHRDDRSFQYVTLRLQCCAGCARPVRQKVRFADPILLLGRKVTGLAAVASGDQLLFILSRPSTIQAAAVPIDPLQAEAAGGVLLPIGSEPLWRRAAAALIPIMMLFFSFSMIFLGFTLIRERGKFVLEALKPAAQEGPRPAEILQRAMAHILDQIVVLPLFYVGVEVLNVSPETSGVDLADPKFQGMLAVGLGINFLYHLVMEWAFGWTLGKRVIGLRVTELDGSRLTFRGALLRNLVRGLEADNPFGILVGAALIMTSRLRQRLGDRLGKTMVVQDLPKAAPPKADPVAEAIRNRKRAEKV